MPSPTGQAQRQEPLSTGHTARPEVGQKGRLVSEEPPHLWGPHCRTPSPLQRQHCRPQPAP